MLMSYTKNNNSKQHETITVVCHCNNFSFLVSLFLLARSRSNNTIFVGPKYLPTVTFTLRDYGASHGQYIVTGIASVGAASTWMLTAAHAAGSTGLAAALTARLAAQTHVLRFANVDKLFSNRSIQSRVGFRNVFCCYCFFFRFGTASGPRATTV